MMKIPIPENIELLEASGNLIIRRKWFGMHAIFLTLFCVAWDGFLVFWYAMAAQSNNVPSMVIWFPIVHVTVGVFLTYYVVACYLNKTDIIISPFSVEVKHHPVKCLGNKTFDVLNIKQLYTSERVSNGRHGQTVFYDVSIIDQDNRQKKLLGGLQTKEQGIFIESKIEEVLGIKDEPVAGAVLKG